MLQRLTFGTGLRSGQLAAKGTCRADQSCPHRPVKASNRHDSREKSVPIVLRWSLWTHASCLDGCPRCCGIRDYLSLRGSQQTILPHPRLTPDYQRNTSEIGALYESGVLKWSVTFRSQLWQDEGGKENPAQRWRQSHADLWRSHAGRNDVRLARLGAQGI